MAHGMFCKYIMFGGSRPPRMATYSGHCCTLPQPFPKNNKQTKTDKLTKHFCITLQNSQQTTKACSKSYWSKGWILRGVEERLGVTDSGEHFLHYPKTIFWTLQSLRRPQERIQVGLLATLPTALSEAYRNIILDCSIKEVLNNPHWQPNHRDVGIGPIFYLVLNREFLQIPRCPKSYIIYPLLSWTSVHVLLTKFQVFQQDAL